MSDRRMDRQADRCTYGRTQSDKQTDRCTVSETKSHMDASRHRCTDRVR